MRKVYDLDRGWRYSPAFSEEMTAEKYDDSRWRKVDLPHANIELPFNYFDDKMFQFVSCYRYKLKKHPGWDKKCVRIRFEGVMTYGRLYVNGKFLSEKKCGYTDWETDITAALHDGSNTVAVMVDSTERPDIPPFGGVIDYLTYGGIYRDVSLIVTERARIEDVFLYSGQISPAADLNAEIAVSPEAVGQEVYLRLYRGAELVAQAETVARAQNVKLVLGGLQVLLWDTGAPNLYDVRVGVRGDEVSLRYGFRTARFTEEGFFLNGKRLQLCGLNRHQSFPYVGYAMPKNAQVRDADILKYKLGVNLVRTSHYPQSRHFLDRCDELGLLVFEEIPGWQHIGDEAWKNLAKQNVRDMIVRDRSRPCVILWGVRINESEDDHDFYTETNRIAHETDPTRQTAGVRWKGHSECLEDVFAINDFMTADDPRPVRDTREMTGKDYDIPYLITEYMGHMFPTKLYDNEERLAKHALRHAEIQNAIRADKRKSGGIGWCAFDYNTHEHFGANDKICYHGVMDMFRTPKYAAFFYESQSDDHPVMEPATIWAFGERSIGGVVPLAIFTNCDKVIFEVEGREPVEYYPDAEHFPNLPHPPVVIREMPDVWGDNWRPAVFTGYRDGSAVIRREYTPSPYAARLSAEADDTVIPVNDVTRIVVRALDQVGNTMKFFGEPLRIRVSGARLIGPAEVSFQGGVYAFWIRSVRKGKVTVAIENMRLGKASVIIAVH